MLDTTQAPTGEGNGVSPEQGDTPGTNLSAEELDRQWRHRVSQKDRAHAAAEQALRDENAALKAQLQARSQSAGQSGAQGNGAGNADIEILREQLAQRDREIERERALRVIESRKAKYPALAQQVGSGDGGIFATADEATLARLNSLAAGIDDDSPLAPTSPRKPATPVKKSYDEMSKEELEAALKANIGRGGHLSNP